jgi:hypothetical protein
MNFKSWQKAKWIQQPSFYSYCWSHYLLII